MPSTQLTSAGKLFIFTLSTSVRCNLVNTLRLIVRERNFKVSYNSLDTTCQGNVVSP